jgi:DMSO/TMAO reductase YedYZ molybdopterin-dependent catalytic subunit
MTRVSDRSRTHLRAGAAAGLLSGAAAVAAAEGVTALLAGVTSPLFAVGVFLFLSAVAGGAGDALPPGFDRRAFLRAAAGVGGVAVAGGLVSRVYGVGAAASRAAVRLPRPGIPAGPVPTGAQLGIRGIMPYLTSNRDFYRVDTALQVPDVPVDGWRLRIHGLVDRELVLDYRDLLSRRLVEERVTLTCVSNEVGGNLLGNAAWLGVPIRDLLREAGVQHGADAVKSTSVDGFTVGTPLPVLLDRGRGALVAVGMNGEPLPLQHGFPARMVTPGLYGFVSATKWLVDLEVTRFADFTAYWTSRGYAARAPVKTSSRIDVPRSFAQVRAGTVPVAGVAWSQGRGLARVEVRATDKTGYTRTARRSPIAPDGATGLDSVSVTVS